MLWDAFWTADRPMSDAAVAQLSALAIQAGIHHLLEELTQEVEYDPSRSAAMGRIAFDVLASGPPDGWVEALHGTVARVADVGARPGRTEPICGA